MLGSGMAKRSHVSHFSVVECSVLVVEGNDRDNRRRTSLSNERESYS